MLIGARTCKYDDEALKYLRSILSDMRSNRTLCEDLFNVLNNKRASNRLVWGVSIIKLSIVEVRQRRGADLIERIAVIFQNIFDTLEILESIKSIQFNQIQKNTLGEIETNIAGVFYSSDSFGSVQHASNYGGYDFLKYEISKAMIDIIYSIQRPTAERIYSVHS